MSGIYKALASILGEIGSIGKDKKNTQQHFQYRGIDDVYNTLNPIMAKHKVFMTPEVIEKTREERQSRSGGMLIYTMLKIKYTFWHEDGTSVSCVVEGEGMDSGDKSANKAMAIAHKYALLQTFCIPVEQTDPDAESHEVVPRSQNTQPQKKSGTPSSLAEVVQYHKLDKKAFYAFANVDSQEAAQALFNDKGALSQMLEDFKNKDK